MSSTVHKNVLAKIVTVPNRYSGSDKCKSVYNSSNDGSVRQCVIKGNTSSNIAILDIERENRISKVISLYSKGLNQEEIAQELHMDRSTVSRDLQFIKQEARKQLLKRKLMLYLRLCNHTIAVFKHLLQDQNPL